MLKLHSEALDFIARAQNHKTLQELIDDFATTIAGQGFRSFIVTGLPAVGVEVEPLVIANRWPEAWADRYREQAYFADDPVSRWSIAMDRPFRWKEAQLSFAPTSRLMRIEGEAWDHGLADGIAFPLRASHNWQAVVSLASEYALDIDKRSEGLLFTAAYFQMAATELAVQKRPPKPELSHREREVLQWRAIGKSYWAISEILSISESTVKKHGLAALRKLDVATTTQAVTKAISLGLIQP